MGNPRTILDIYQLVLYEFIHVIDLMNEKEEIILGVRRIEIHHT